ncbi:MAG: efflux RND transporter periplasmic adaptor subunit [Methylovulum sp.]|uniref:efflux RND transporter periplasmic adaptor subunit n=1 Tax=Methylovulum sp. TaxID=1916980 RepID=UPI00262E8AAC|nr:efflux RND transporter periplasmic adaptor subunit [Methylovulum sp.]MDD2725383.1 efflux RND transporter periplasmic adaptor subunit [Methylovulum sp.]MDD5125548.1 efflux RND transporter periplasmic adaptor subunit [Methylovulum sp.]
MKLFYSLILLIINTAANTSIGAQTPMMVKATPMLMQQIKIIAIGSGQVHDSLRLPARVELDQQRVARIGATVTGRIIETRAVLGQEVHKGGQLATLNSTELGLAQSAYLKTRSQLALRQLTVNRAKRLFASDIIPAAELEERESLLSEADIDLRTATDQLRVFGMSDADLARLAKERKIHSLLPITTSIQGTIVERTVTVGQVVQPADALFTVADLSHVWVVAELPEQQADWARKGDEAWVTIPALPDQEQRGPLVYVADMVDPNTRTVTVRMALPNPQRIFKPQMLATLVIHKPGRQELVLPDAAVVRVDDHDHVFVQTTADEFTLKPVKLGNRDGNIRRVLGGLQSGEKVVVEGGFHLNNERQRKELE